MSSNMMRNWTVSLTILFLLIISVSFVHGRSSAAEREGLFTNWFRNSFNASVGPGQNPKHVFRPILKTQISPEERKQHFLKELDDIEEHNANPHREFEMGVTSLTGLTEEERNAFIVPHGIDPGQPPSSHPTDKRQTAAPFNRPLPTTVPASFDWRAKKVVSSVKNQGQCGSCVWFSGAAVAESAWRLAGGPLLDLSEQAGLDCTSGNQCGGTLFTGAFTYGSKYGWIPDADRRYATVDHATCGQNSARVVVKFPTTNSHYMSGTSEAELQKWLMTYGPLHTMLHVDSAFMNYKSGVFSSSTCNLQENHAVMLVGWGVTTTGVPYWIVKNSWGTGWGELGYFRIRRGNSMCKIGRVSMAVVAPAQHPLVGKGCFPPPATGSPLPKQLTSATNNLPERCVARCVAAGKFLYAATKAGNQCWCGNTTRLGAVRPSSECNSRCTGDAGRYGCGAASRFNLYRTWVPAPVAKAELTAADSSTTHHHSSSATVVIVVVVCVVGAALILAVALFVFLRKRAATESAGYRLGVANSDS